jgi:RNA-directed DNA polymerase
LHRWATDDPHRRFDDLFNLVVDPATLACAWERVRTNRGARTAGVDGTTAAYIERVRGVEEFLAELRADLKADTFRPLPARERMIPKSGDRSRRLGIPTVRDRVAQAALKLVLEPILEADFQPCSYGFRPGRRAQDAIAEIRHFSSRRAGYEWVLEADIEACFDRIDHVALMDRLRRRIGDKRVLSLIKAFLKAGILTEGGDHRDTTTGTPQGGILSPLLANVALTALDEHFAGIGQDRNERARRRYHGLANYRLIRYADDFVVMVFGTRAHASDLRDELTTVLAPMGLCLSAPKTRVVHIDEGFDFLGYRIRRARKRGADKRYVYTYPSRAALWAVMAKVRALTQRRGTNQPLAVLLNRLNSVLRGWSGYFRHSVFKATASYLHSFTWRRVVAWLHHKHPRASWKELFRRYGLGRGPIDGDVSLFKVYAVAANRYRYRGHRIATPWTEATDAAIHAAVA